jgi:polyketide synthase 13
MKTTHDIENWLVQYLAGELKIPVADLPRDEPLTNLGLSSRQAVMLTGEVEEWLGRPVDPAVAWEHPTVAALAKALSEAQAEAA